LDPVEPDESWGAWFPAAPVFEDQALGFSSKTAPRILIFSIAIGADYSYEMKNSEI
jgi:hypothetical protein